MIFHQQAKIDWQLLKRQHRTQAIMKNEKEIKNRVPHDYKVGDLVLIVQKSYERVKKAKLSTPNKGPFPIIRTYANRNEHIQCRNYKEDISIRRIHPYHPTN